MFDERREKELVREWEQSNSAEALSIEEIANTASQGLTFCEGYCASRELVGQDCCYCVRARFPSPEHYQLYEIARTQYLKMLATRVGAEAYGESNEQDD